MVAAVQAQWVLPEQWSSRRGPAAALNNLPDVQAGEEQQWPLRAAAAAVGVLDCYSLDMQARREHQNLRKRPDVSVV